MGAACGAGAHNELSQEVQRTGRNIPMAAIDFGEMAIWLVAFLFSVTAHEAAHAFVAMKGGDLTAYHTGQVTLNPLPHIRRSPFGMLLVPVFFFVTSGYMIGWASAPYDRNWAASYPRRAAWMALAGPGANLLIFMAVIFVTKIGLAAGVFQPPDASAMTISSIISADSGLWVSIAKMLSIFLFLNLILLVFNLFPFPPLDGSSVITLFMPQAMAVRFSQFVGQPMYSLLGIILAWRFIGVIFGPALRLTIQLLYG